MILVLIFISFSNQNPWEHFGWVLAYSGRLRGSLGAPGGRFEDILGDFGVALGSFLAGFWSTLENSMSIEFLPGGSRRFFVDFGRFLIDFR